MRSGDLRHEDELRDLFPLKLLFWGTVVKRKLAGQVGSLHGPNCRLKIPLASWPCHNPDPHLVSRTQSGKTEALLSISTGVEGQAGVFSLAGQTQNFHMAG